MSPRRDPYTNEKYGWDVPDDPAPDKTYTAEDVVESRRLIRECDGSILRRTQEAWHESLAYHSLRDPESNTGIWIPKWVGLGLRSARLSRLLAWLLWWFDDDVSTSAKSRRLPNLTRASGPGHCRARGRDEDGIRVLVTSYRRLAKEVNLERSTTTRMVGKLKDLKLIRTSRPSTGKYARRLLVHLMPAPLARLYMGQTGDMEAYHELLHPDSEYKRLARMTPAQWEQEYEERVKWLEREGKEYSPRHPLADLNDWFATKTRRRAMDRRHGGVFVPDLVLAACEGKIAEAWLLSQALWWFGVTEKNTTRARIIRHNYLWMAKSDRQWDRELGLPRSGVRRALNYLVHQRKFLVEDGWVVDRLRDRGQPTSHIRPNVAELEKVLLDVDVIDLANDLGASRMSKW